MATLDANAVAKSIANGSFIPDRYLTNMSMAFFQSPDNYVAGKIFPMLPVQLSSGKYYKFDKAMLNRDDMQTKPAFGKVQPINYGLETDQYMCEVKQLLIGLDQIEGTNWARGGVVGVSDPRRGRVKVAQEKVKIHLDHMFAENFFKSGAWSNEYEGKPSSPDTGNKEFLQFSNDSSDPVEFVENIKKDMLLRGLREPNRIALGIETYIALTNNECIKERVKYGGTTANPATVTKQALAQLFGVRQLEVLKSVYNTADFGDDANMQFICDPKGMLLCYAPDSPAIDEPSAGYTFTWDMLGNGQYMQLSQWEGEKGTHADFIEVLCGFAMKKTSDECGVFLNNCAG